jgi:hypothetical protein
MVSDKPDFYHTTSPGYPTQFDGLHRETVEWTGNIAANGSQIFTWFPVVSVTAVTDSPLPITCTIDDGTGAVYLTVGPFIGSVVVPFAQPRTNYFVLASRIYNITNPNAFDINVTINWIRRNGSLYNSVAIVVPPGGIIFASFADFGGPGLDKDWGPDSVILRTTAKGCQKYQMYLSTFLGTYWYAACSYYSEGFYNFMYNASIGFPIVGCHEEIFNSNDQVRSFTRIFNYTWDEALAP